MGHQCVDTDMHRSSTEIICFSMYTVSWHSGGFEKQNCWNSLKDLRSIFFSHCPSLISIQMPLEMSRNSTFPGPRMEKRVNWWPQKVIERRQQSKQGSGPLTSFLSCHPFLPLAILERLFMKTPENVQPKQTHCNQFKGWFWSAVWGFGKGSLARVTDL